MAKILLAEDDLFLRDIYLEILKSEGYSVTPATDGEQALAELKKGGWDLVLLDMIMPKLSGADVLKNIEKNKLKNLAKHIVFMTNTDETKNLAAVNDLIDGNILKSSFDPPQLLEKIKGFLH